MFGSGASKGDLVIACKPAEMIQPDNIHKFEHRAETIDPPLIASLLMFAPLIEWIAP